MVKLAGLKGFLATVIDKISPKRRQARVFQRKEQAKDSPFFDKINQDKLNVTQQKTKIKGQKKFLYDLSIVTMFQMISLYWTQRMSGVFITTNPRPVEYGTMPTVMRRTKRSTIQKQIINDVRYKGKTYYTYGLKKSQIKSLVRADRAKMKLAAAEKRKTFKGNAAEKRQMERKTYKQLMAQRMSENVNSR